MTLDSSSGKATAEVAHEQLLRSWPTLVGWVEERREFLTWKSILEADRLDYDNTPTNVKTTALLMGRKLSVARGWLASHADDLGPEERKFISDSIAEEKKQLEEKNEARRRAEKARTRTGGARLTVAGMRGAFTALASERLSGISSHDLLSYGPAAIVLLALLVFLIQLIFFLPKLTRYRSGSRSRSGR